MTTEQYLEKYVDPEFLKGAEGDPVLEEWVLSPEEEVIRFASEMMAGVPEAWSRIERQRFVG